MKEKAADYQEQFSGLNASQMLAVLLENHPGKVVFSTSLGAEDQVVTHMLVQAGKRDGIFTLDTGRMFPETYEVLEKTNARYGISIDLFFPDYEKVEKMVGSKGINLFYYSVENRKECCHVRKIEPLRRSLSGHEVWITGLRREQSPTRTGHAYAEWDETNKIIKVNPLLDWTEQDVWAFIRQHRIPYNSLHDKGFPSIGCQPCTRAVAPGEDIRSGRWWWENPATKECGLHPLGGDQVVE
jgi:phosphoadenosine phosphosulfate reductase